MLKFVPTIQTRDIIIVLENSTHFKTYFLSYEKA